MLEGTKGVIRSCKNEEEQEIHLPKRKRQITKQTMVDKTHITKD